MTEITRTQLDLRITPNDGPHEVFRAEGYFHGKPTIKDVRLVVGTLAMDLLSVQPPLPDGFGDDITIRTGRNFGRGDGYTVVADYVRTDAFTTNAPALGYAYQGHSFPRD